MTFFADYSVAPVTTLGWVGVVAFATIIMWWRALTAQGGHIERVEVGLFAVIMLLCLGTAASFMVVMKPSEIAVTLTAWAFLAGSITTSGATGVLYAKYLKQPQPIFVRTR